ncbi:MAG: gliding motility-associated C-terminal domain-containing protein [Taibaiella sp.]|nr:gliding motility-associated C-terminal domain-containing protein [Taibaiella sp.]
MKRLAILIVLLVVAHLSFGCTPTVNIAASPNDTVCSGRSVTYTATMVGGGASVAYQWYVNGSTVAATGNTMTYVPGHSDSVRCLITTSGGACTTTASVSSNTVNMVVYPSPSVPVVTGPPGVCIGASVPLSASPSGGTWASSNPTVATINTISGDAQSLAIGTSVITYTMGPDVNGCSSYDTFTLNVITSSFTLSGAATDGLCYGDSSGTITVAVDPAGTNYSYTWSYGGSLAAATGLQVGTYSVLVTDTFSKCKLSRSFIIGQPDSLHAVISGENRVCHVGGFLEAEVSGGVAPYRYAWFGPRDTLDGKHIIPVDGGTYTLSVTDTNGCKGEWSAVFMDIPCNSVFILAGFSPNGDGINDKWYVSGLTEYPKNTVQVFDRWGDLVYEKTNYQGEWDGVSKGGAHLPDGTYYYLVKLNEPSKTGGDNVFKGAVLIRR